MAIEARLAVNTIQAIQPRTTIHAVVRVASRPTPYTTLPCLAGVASQAIIPAMPR
jgi:hypothetical protein